MESALFEMFSLTQYSEPELDPMWVALWCLYGNEPSDVINVVSAFWD